MKLLAWTVLLTAATATVVPSYGNPCPISGCQQETIRPNCTPGHACPQWIRVVTVCPWKCNAPIPSSFSQDSGCTQLPQAYGSKQCQIQCNFDPCSENTVI